MKCPIRKRLRDTVIIISITFFLMVLLEAAVRISGISPAEPVLTEGMQADPVLLWKTIPGSYGQKSSRFVPTVSYVHNSNGYRMRHDIEPKKSDTFRVLMLGDSNIWGFGVEQAQTAASVLQSMFDEQQSVQNNEIINMGVIGYSSFQGIKLLEQSLSFQPDLIVLGYGYNDRRYIASKSVQDSDTYFTQTYRAVRIHKMLMERSSLCNWLASWNKKPNSTSLQYAVPRVSAEQYKINFQLMLDFCQQHNLPVIVLGLHDNPAFINRINQAVQFELDGMVMNAAKLYSDILSSPNLTESSLAPYMFSQLIKNSSSGDQNAIQELFQISSIDELLNSLNYIQLPLDSMMGMTVIRRDQDYLAVLPEICSNYYNAQYVDFKQVISDLSDDELHQCYFPVDPCHINSKGHHLLAKHLATVIKEHAQQEQ